MITNYYTLKALAGAWNAGLRDCVVGDVYSQSKDELSVAFSGQDTVWLLRASVRAPFQYIFCSEGYNKARRNVATLFRTVFDASVTDVYLAERDRVLWIDLSCGLRLQYVLFGPRANVYLVDRAGFIVEAFQRNDVLQGTPAPLPAPAPTVDTMDAFLARWQSTAPTVIRAITLVFPFFNATLAREALARSGVTASGPADCTGEDLERLFASARAMEEALNRPHPRIYWQDDRVKAFSLIDLDEFAGLRAERFDDVDQALTVFIRKKLGQQAFDAVYLPLEKALSDACEQNSRRLDDLVESLSEESRADRYERWGHLLMASPSVVDSGATSVELEDLFDENKRVEIPLNPGLTVVENAQRFYDKARQTRLARSHAEDRLSEIEDRTNEAKTLLDELQGLKTRAEVVQFQKEKSDMLAPHLGQKAANADEQIPFRRYPLAGGYEVWVGKNARQNDLLTFDYARKFDFWLHARGVSGSHTVLRRPGRTARPDKIILEQAASIAAFHSKARGSELVPVIVTEKKYVRRPRGAAAGTVLVEREQVLLVEPRLPAGK